MTYGKASFLLKWNGKGGAYFWDYYASGTANNPWDPNWTMDIGTPTAAMYSVGSGAFRRDYTAGTVIVNPMLTTQTFSLGGTYTTASGASVSSVTLAPTSAAILHSTATVPVVSSQQHRLPVISGTAQVGSQLTASTGSWSGSPTSYSLPVAPLRHGGRELQRDQRRNQQQLPARQRRPGRNDPRRRHRHQQRRIHKRRLRTNRSRASSDRPRVSSGNTSLPVISGTAQVGSQLTASTGSWSGSPTSYSYQWHRCDTAGANCSRDQRRNQQQLPAHKRRPGSNDPRHRHRLQQRRIHERRLRTNRSRASSGVAASLLRTPACR